MARIFLAVLAALSLHGAQVWTVRVEEPTGLYPRDRETVSIPLARLGGNRSGFTVTDPHGVEQPLQMTATELLFPVSLIPGELPRYHVACCRDSAAKTFPNPILVRQLGVARVEFGNPRFRAVVDRNTAAIVEVYALAAGTESILNPV